MTKVRKINKKLRYIVSYLIRKNDKRGESGLCRITDARNGEIIYTSEKYTNISFGRRRSKQTAEDLKDSEYKEHDFRKKD